MQSTETGLRERKRVETRHRIADAALELTLEHGLDGATVDAISAAAGVSPRTFFNYFESKDDALLNAPDAHEIEAMVAATVAASDDLSVREVAVRFFVEKIRTTLQSGTQRAQRRELFDRYPHLLATAFRQLGDTQEAFSGALVRIATARAVGTDQDTAWADIAIIAAAFAVRAAMTEAAKRPGLATTDQIEERANALLKTTWENLT
ncbi:TetR/AcrR family transcriptional regulator [Cellulomonas sp. URHD0024]|uniref:TetR/AcrR family transcriptional regulator n=1 Tax=Cellulomonas sp. URHD0024 TaxID=1302620 RepID=UPI0003F8D0C4|nr:TetR/AcrR family transcriptional regulator [Cellulomonas sp. URHD0024]